MNEKGAQEVAVEEAEEQRDSCGPDAQEAVG